MTARVSLPFHVFPQDCWLVPGGWCLFFMLCGPLAVGEEVSGQTDSPPADIEFDSRLLDSLGINIDLARFSRADFIPPGRYQLDITINGKERMSQ